MLQPRDSHDLGLHSATLTAAVPHTLAHDVFGNSLAYLEWERVDTRLLRIVSSVELDHSPSEADLPLDPAAEIYPFSSMTDEPPELSRTPKRQYPDPGRAGQRRRRLQPRLGGGVPTRRRLGGMRPDQRVDRRAQLELHLHCPHAGAGNARQRRLFG